MLAATAAKWRRPLVFVNQVGGQDDLVFDGASMAFDARGSRIARAAELRADLVVVDIDRRHGRGAPDSPLAPEASDERSALAALVLGTRDYARRCGFSQALLGLSGGIDSALVACIAARALGPRQRARRRDAVAVFVARLDHRRRGAGARRWASTSR